MKSMNKKGKIDFLCSWTLLQLEIFSEISKFKQENTGKYDQVKMRKEIKKHLNHKFKNKMKDF